MDEPNLLLEIVRSELPTIILIGLSGFIGKLWAEREIRKVSHRHSEKLASVSHELELLRERQLRTHNDKLIIYRHAMDNIVSTLAKLELYVMKKREFLSAEELEVFATERLRMYAYIGMLAPQEVMDANDKLTDLLLGVVFNNEQTDWKTIRDHALVLINAIRWDIGIDASEVSYNGER